MRIPTEDFTDVALVSEDTDNLVDRPTQLICISDICYVNIQIQKTKQGNLLLITMTTLMTLISLIAMMTMMIVVKYLPEMVKCCLFFSFFPQYTWNCEAVCDKWEKKRNNVRVYKEVHRCKGKTNSC